MVTRRKLCVEYTVTAKQRQWIYKTITLIARLQEPGPVDSAAKEDLEHCRHIDASHFLEEDGLGFTVVAGGTDKIMVLDSDGWCQPESVAVFLQGLLKSTGDERVFHGTYSEENTGNDTVEFSGGFFVVDQHDYRVEGVRTRMADVLQEFLKS